MIGFLNPSFIKEVRDARVGRQIVIDESVKLDREGKYKEAISISEEALKVATENVESTHDDIEAIHMRALETLEKNMV